MLPSMLPPGTASTAADGRVCVASAAAPRHATRLTNKYPPVEARLCMTAPTARGAPRKEIKLAREHERERLLESRRRAVAQVTASAAAPVHTSSREETPLTAAAGHPSAAPPARRVSTRTHTPPSLPPSRPTSLPPSLPALPGGLARSCSSCSRGGAAAGPRRRQRREGASSGRLPRTRFRGRFVEGSSRRQGRGERQAAEEGVMLSPREELGGIPSRRPSAPRPGRDDAAGRQPRQRAYGTCPGHVADASR